MHLYKFLVAMPVAFGLMACGDDSSSSSPETVDPALSSAVVDPAYSSAYVDPAVSSAVVDPGVTSSASTATSLLPAGANIANATTLYSAWKARWVMTLNEEVAGGSTLDYTMYTGSRAQELLPQKMGVFYSNPARVIWDGGTSAQCELTDMTQWGTKTLTAGLRKKLGCSVSEGIGYGMLISVLNNDQELFNGLWAYNIMARDNNNNGLMPWELQSFSNTVSTAAALDADIDVATALILAAYKWSDMSGYYMADAQTLITSIYNSGINQENLLIRPGDTWLGQDVYNLSYFSPAALRLFAVVTPSIPWEAILAANYAYMANVQALGAVPLFPDWSNAAGLPTDPNNGSAANSYMLFDKESVRIGWRIAWDYYWNQDANAQAILAKMANFISNYTSGDPANIPQYSFNVSTGELSTSGIVGMHYTGNYCMMGMGVNQTWLDACYQKFTTDVASASMVGYTGTYFKEILTMMYTTFMNGGFVKPF